MLVQSLSVTVPLNLGRKMFVRVAEGLWLTRSRRADMTPKDPETRRKAKRLYRAAHRDERREYNKKWRAAHPKRETARNCLTPGCGGTWLSFYSFRKHCSDCISQKRSKSRRYEHRFNPRPRKYGVRETLYWGARSRAKEKNVPIDITKEDITIPEKCPLLGIPLMVAVGKRAPMPNSPTLDRKIPALGYIKGNIQVISFKANVMKSDASLAEMQVLVKNWEDLVNGSTLYQ